jgi:hypothetical protein
VAVGYLLRPDELEGGIYHVTTADAHAWVEVHLAGFGWVPFDPARADGDTADVPIRSSDVTFESAFAQSAADREGRSGGVVPGEAPGALRGTAWIVVLVVAGMAAVLLSIALAKVLRRSARARRGPPARRIIGAWREVADRLREAGVRVPASRTVKEVARDMAQTSAAPVSRHVDALATVVASAVFGFDEPSEADAARAWVLERSVRRDLAHVLPLTVRLRGRLDPRSLVPHRTRRRTPRPGPTSPTRHLTGTARHGA